MYYAYFGLDQPPYRITPDTQLFYSGGARGDILAALVHAIVSGEGITKVVGEVGSGKTMLCRMLELKLPQSVEIVYLPNPSIAPEHILHAIAFEMGLTVEARDNRYEVMKHLQEHLLKKHMNDRQVVVFVEEAQGMPLETLEEIRLLSNLETQKHKLLQVVLFGQPELDVNLGAAHVRQIKERITNGFYLPPLSLQDVRDYLMFRLRQAGYQGPDLFSADAVRAFAKASRGLMRRLNILADKALLAAFSADERVITARHVRAALIDSEFSARGPGAMWAGGILSGLALAASAWASSIRFTPAAAEAGRGSACEDPAPEPAPAVCGAASEEAVGECGRIAHTGITESRLEATQAWLTNADPDHYSVQILQAEGDAAPQIDRLLSGGEVRDRLDHVYIYRSEVRGNPMLSVLYGSYDSFAAASEAVRGLQSALPGFLPYVRTVRKVRDEAGAVHM
ncbi:MAG: AAA family ATPase [Gammaproteobacteria bacterium]|nr:AAA family ATPase [Gammaproteobacteria bacterium]